MPLVANAQADSPIGFERHTGATRYGTAAEIAAAAYSASTDVVIATGEGFANALAGAALEGDLDAPVLLVPSDLVGGRCPPRSPTPSTTSAPPPPRCWAVRTRSPRTSRTSPTTSSTTPR